MIEKPIMSQSEPNVSDKLAAGCGYPAWSIMQRADDRNVKRANLQLKTDIANGARGVALIFEGAHNAFGFGLPIADNTFDILFDGVDLDGLHIRLDNHPHGSTISDSLIEYLRKRKLNAARTSLTFSTDPSAVLATTGRLKMSIEALRASLPQSMSAFFSSGLPGIVLEADGRPYHNAGATDAQEIGAMLSVALSHLKMVEDARHHIAYALPHIGFATALDNNFTMGLVKLKAIKHLWQRLQIERGVPVPFATNIHVETSMRMMTKQGASNNITRANIAALAAICGGAKSLSVLPFSAVFGLPNAHARAVARNSQLVIAMENTAGLCQTTNHAEQLDKLIETAWQEFERFEAAGGVLQYLIDGKLAKAFEEARDLRKTNYLKGENHIIGVTRFIQEQPKVKDVLDEEPAQTQIDGIKHCEPLQMARDETDFLDTIALAPVEARKVRS